MNWTNLITAAKDRAATAATAASKYAEILRGYVDVDIPGRRFFIADTILKKLLEAGLEAKDMALISLDHRGEAHHLVLKTKEGTLSAVVTLREIRWADVDQFAVVVETPEPPTVAEKPGVTWLISAIATLIGGTQLAEDTFAMALPEDLKWDGKRAVATFRVPAARRLPESLLKAGPLSLPADTSGPLGIWFACNDAALLSRLTDQVSSLAVQYLTARILRGR